MKRFLKVVVPCILLVVLAPTLWSTITELCDTFSAQPPLEVDAGALKATCVSSHLEATIQEDTNVLWCGTFQLAWNEACALVGEDLRFAGQAPEMVAILNKKAFLKDDLDEASYVAQADFVRNDIHGRIEREMSRKFSGQAQPQLLPSPTDASRPQDIVAYAYLSKALEFAIPFERLDQPLSFGNVQVASFGIGNEFKSGQVAMYDQVVVLDYQSPDDFVIELRTKSPDDHLILAKTRPERTLQETILAVQDRATRGKLVPAGEGRAVLQVPKFHFEITCRYHELLGARLQVNNPAIAKDLQIVAAAQNTKFQMDEKGVKLRSEAHLNFGCAARDDSPPMHVMIFDKPFLLMLQRSKAQKPYFALWIGNAELLQHVKE